MLLDGAEQLSHRRIMQEAFTANRLAGYLDPMNEILSAAFVDSVRAGTAAVRVPVPGLRWSKGLRGRALLEDYLRPRVATKRTSEGNDLFSALCHAQVADESFTDDDVINHMTFLLMAAHDTSTITLTTMVYYLAKHPEWLERRPARASGPTCGAGTNMASGGPTRNAFMPFGHGVHKCIGMYFGGMEVKAAMHQLLLRYRFSVPAGYTMPVDRTSLPRPRDGLPVTLHRR